MRTGMWTRALTRRDGASVTPTLDEGAKAPLRPSRLLVCGSRDWDDLDTITETLAEYVGRPHMVLIHGAARGADTLAAEVAEFYGWDVRAFPADWERHGKRAGPLRNVQMLGERPDLVLAFQRNGSTGTQHTIDEARKRGIPVEVITA